MSAVRQKLWQSMRIMRRFTLPQLMATSGATESPTRAYVNALKRAGFLAVRRPAQGMAGAYAVYQLLQDSGPQHPTTNSIQVVYDPNRDSYHLPQQMKERIDAALADCTARRG